MLRLYIRRIWTITSGLIAAWPFCEVLQEGTSTIMWRCWKCSAQLVSEELSQIQSWIITGYKRWPLKERAVQVCVCVRESHRLLYLRGDGAEMKIKVLTRMGVAVGVCGAERAFKCRIITCGDSQTMWHFSSASKKTDGWHEAAVGH